MVRGTLLVGMVAMILLAGCIGPQGGDSDEVQRGQAAPEWTIGQYWTLDTDVFGEMTLVVVGEEDEEWIMGTANEDLAWFHVLEEVSFLDQIRKSDLAGSQEGERVRFLDFPLEEGRNWTTFWGEGERRIEVAEAGDDFVLKGYDNGHLGVVYVYNPTVGWFTDMEYYDEEGEVEYKFILTDHGTDYAGQIANWSTPAEMGLSGDLPVQGAGFTVPEQVQDLFITFQFGCEGQQGTYDLRIQHSGTPPLSDDGYTRSGGCETIDLQEVIPDPEPGPWSIDWQQLFLPEMPGYDIQVWARHLGWDTLEQ